MDTFELIIRTEHPPHPAAPEKNGLPLRPILFKFGLFLIIFIFSFHLSLSHFAQDILDLEPGSRNREKTIREMVAVLEKHQTGLANVTREELAEVIYEEALRYNQDPKFILALIAIESSFDNSSVSEKGAKGLMQMMPYVAQSVAHQMGIEWTGDRTLFNPFLNVRMGIHYLSQLILDFDDLGLAVAAYNFGPTYVRDLMGRKEKLPLDFYRKLLLVYHTL
jgi:soluble lytic murein transglycosylase-like protein